jgi:osmotically-inducible protein OsmY
MERSRLVSSAIVAMLVCGGSLAAAAGDADIQKCITDKLAAAPKLSAQGFSATVNAGQATLTGTARNPGSKGAASGIAKRCNATTVSNEIVIDKSAAKFGQKSKTATETEAETASNAAPPAVDAPAKSAMSSSATDQVKESAASSIKDVASSKAKSVVAPAMP